MSSDELVLYAMVKAAQYRLGMAYVKSIIDTGSNRSMMGYGEIDRLNFPQARLSFSEMSYIGGGSLKLHRMDDVVLIMDDEENQTIRLKTQRLFAATPSKQNDWERLRAKSIPSIIGLDFLAEQGIGLYCNPSKKDAYLELP